MIRHTDNELLYYIFLHWSRYFESLLAFQAKARGPRDFAVPLEGRCLDYFPFLRLFPHGMLTVREVVGALFAGGVTAGSARTHFN